MHAVGDEKVRHGTGKDNRYQKVHDLRHFYLDPTTLNR